MVHEIAKTHVAHIATFLAGIPNTENLYRLSSQTHTHYGLFIQTCPWISTHCLTPISKVELGLSFLRLRQHTKNRSATYLATQTEVSRRTKVCVCVWIPPLALNLRITPCMVSSHIFYKNCFKQAKLFINIDSWRKMWNKSWFPNWCLKLCNSHEVRKVTVVIKSNYLSWFCREDE